MKFRQCNVCTIGEWLSQFKLSYIISSDVEDDTTLILPSCSCCINTIISFSYSEIRPPHVTSCCVQINTLTPFRFSGFVQRPSLEGCDWTGKLPNLCTLSRKNVKPRCSPTNLPWLNTYSLQTHLFVCQHMQILVTASSAASITTTKTSHVTSWWPRLTPELQKKNKGEKSLKATWQPNEHDLVQAVSTHSLLCLVVTVTGP